MTAPSNYPSEQTGDGARSRGWLTRPCKRAGSSSAGKPAGQRRRGGFACVIQPHCEERPEFGLSIYEIYDMKACRITTLFSGRGEGGREKIQGKKGNVGGFAFAVQPHLIRRDRSLGSQFMKFMI